MLNKINLMNENSLQFVKIYTFIFGIISTIKIIHPGEIYLGEIIVIIYSFFYFYKVKNIPIIKKILIYGLLWSSVQLVSDIFNNTSLISSLKGVFAPQFLILTIVGFVAFFKDRISLIPLYLLGLTVGFIILDYVFPSEYYIDNPWKWGVGLGFISIIGIYYSFYYKKNSKLFLLILLTLFMVLSIYFNARSLGFLPLISGLIYCKYYNGVYKNIFITKYFLIKILVAGLIFLLAFNLIISIILSSDYILHALPADVALKFKAQEEGSYGLLLGGRSEVASSLNAFLDSPFLGHGSWAIDSEGKYSSLQEEYIYRLGYGELSNGPDLRDYDRELIPTHSYIMGALVWGGFLAGAFWVVIIRYLFYQVILNMSVLPYYFYLNSIFFFWNVFFSPFGANSRFNTSIFLAMFISYSYNLRHNKLINEI